MSNRRTSSRQRRTNMNFSTSPDHISNLPDVILEEILQRLPLKESVRTSVLSSVWKDKWKGIPHIVLDKYNLESTREKILTENFAYVVDKVLGNHQGEIHKFKLSLFYLKAIRSSWHINRWIQLLVDKNIQDLHIDIHNGAVYLEERPLFACKKLRVLKLRNCSLKPDDTSNPFMFLQELYLEDSEISEYDLKKFLEKCPVLEKLSLANLHVDPIEVDVPTLRILVIEGRFSDLRLKNSQGVTKFLIHKSTPIANVHGINFNSACKLSSVLAGVPNVEILHVWSRSMELLSLGNVCPVLPFMLNNLREVFLAVNFGNKDEVSAALCLVKSSPNLVHLSIGVYLKRVASTTKADELWKEHREIGYLFRHLKAVTLLQFLGTKSENEFIVYILENSPQLGKLFIEFRHISYDGLVQWSDGLPTGTKCIIQVTSSTKKIDFKKGLPKKSAVR